MESPNNIGLTPTHIPFPDYGTSQDIFNEVFISVFALFCAFLQFLHIYKTIFWLPELHQTSAVHWDLIDPHLVVFIVVIISRRLIYAFLRITIDKTVISNKKKKLYKTVGKFSLISIFVVILTVCLIQIFIAHGYLAIFCLSYPFAIYLFFFGFNLNQFLQVSTDSGGSYINGMPMHCCSTNAITIRDEVDFLKNDFNVRFKQIIFTSILNAYFAGCVPCFFAQKAINYDMLIAMVNVMNFWVGGFALSTVFSLPAKYCDILHRASLHLGKWIQIEDSGSSKTQLWSKGTSWEEGSYIKHNEKFYRSVGPVTTAVPGNSSHQRFFKIFNNPSYAFMVLSMSMVGFVLLQMMLLYLFIIEWHSVICIGFLCMTNNFCLFKILRDYLITHRIYSTEMSLYEKKFNTHFQ